MGIFDLLSYETLRGGRDSSGVTADRDGNIEERLEDIRENLGGAAGAVTWNTVDTPYQLSVVSSTSFGAYIGLVDNFTLTSPGTTWTTVFNVTGKGYLLGLNVEQPSTTTAATMQMRLTLDGVVIYNGDLGSNTTSGLDIGIIGVAGRAGGSTLRFHFSAPVFMPFNTGIHLELRYNPAPSAGENITGGFVLVYE